MEMKVTLEQNIEVLLNVYGLKMHKNYKFRSGINLPKRRDLLTSEREKYKSKSEAKKIKIINELLYKDNHLEISNWELFIPNLKNNEDESLLNYIFHNVRILYSNGEFNYHFHNLIDFLIVDTLNNKYLTDRFSKEFQLKKMFSSNSKMTKQLRKEFLILIDAKIIDMKIKEVLDTVLPKLVLDELNNNDNI